MLDNLENLTVNHVSKKLKSEVEEQMRQMCVIKATDFAEYSQRFETIQAYTRVLQSIQEHLQEILNANGH